MTLWPVLCCWITDLEGLSFLSGTLAMSDWSYSLLHLRPVLAYVLLEIRVQLRIVHVLLWLKVFLLSITQPSGNYLASSLVRAQFCCLGSSVLSEYFNILTPLLFPPNMTVSIYGKWLYCDHDRSGTSLFYNTWKKLGWSVCLMLILFTSYSVIEFWAGCRHSHQLSGTGILYYSWKRSWIKLDISNLNRNWF